MKKLLLMFITALSLLIGTTEIIEASELENKSHVKLATKYECDYGNINYCGESKVVEVASQSEVKENILATNQTTLFYMYSTSEGHFLLDPLADNENVIFVEKHDMPKLKHKLHHGKKFIGTFADNDLWELEGLSEVLYK